MSKTASSGMSILSAEEGGRLVKELAQRAIVLMEEKLGRPLCQASIFHHQTGICRIQFCCDTTPISGGQIKRELVQADVCLETGEVLFELSDIVLDRPTELFSDPASALIKINHYTVDPKGRITIPRTFIQQFIESKTRVVLTEGPMNTVLVVEMSTWDGLCEAKKGDRYFERTYLNKAQEIKNIHFRTGRVLITEQIRRHAGIHFGQELIAFNLNGCPGVLLYMPTTHYLKIKRKGGLSLVAQKLRFDMIKPTVS